MSEIEQQNYTKGGKTGKLKIINICELFDGRSLILDTYGVENLNLASSAYALARH
jgi:hypothetical protein